ncbi:hypothetical protein GW17_00012057 [Ensete ventricosum]|nr:hypothetical protein GW17_00012057 [Ensete ventricosum]
MLCAIHYVTLALVGHIDVVEILTPKMSRAFLDTNPIGALSVPLRCSPPRRVHRASLDAHPVSPTWIDYTCAGTMRCHQGDARGVDVGALKCSGDDLHKGQGWEWVSQPSPSDAQVSPEVR